LVFYSSSLGHLGLLCIKNVFLLFYSWRGWAENVQSYVEAAMLIICISFLLLYYPKSSNE
jgi:hypothetical protein